MSFLYLHKSIPLQNVFFAFSCESLFGERLFVFCELQRRTFTVFFVARAFPWSKPDGSWRPEGAVRLDLPSRLLGEPDTPEKVEQKRHRVQREVTRDGTGAFFYLQFVFFV